MLLSMRMWWFALLQVYIIMHALLHHFCLSNVIWTRFKRSCSVRLDCIRRFVTILLQERGRFLVYAHQRRLIEFPLLHSSVFVRFFTTVRTQSMFLLAALFFLLLDNLISHADNVVNYWLIEQARVPNVNNWEEWFGCHGVGARKLCCWAL